MIKPKRAPAEYHSTTLYIYCSTVVEYKLYTPEKKTNLGLYFNLGLCFKVIRMATILTQQKIVPTLLTMFQTQRVEFIGFKQRMVRKGLVKLRVIS